MQLSKTKEMGIAITAMMLVATAALTAETQVGKPTIIDQPKGVNAKVGDRIVLSVNAAETFDSNQDFTLNLTNSTTTNTATLDMIWCPPGTFMMGSPTNELGSKHDASYTGWGSMEANEDLHQVTLTKGFWLGKYEVTQAQYLAVVGEYPEYFSTDGEYFGENKPMVLISFNDAMNFCRKLTQIERTAGRISPYYEYTLPTEAQWEYACRAGTTSALYNGKELTSAYGFCTSLENIAWYYYNTVQGIVGDHVQDVGQKLPNSWGFYDILGNAEEFCLDCCVRNLGTNAVIDPYNVGDGDFIVLRGGSFSSSPDEIRSAFREGYSSDCNTYIGFRVALVPVQF